MPITVATTTHGRPALEALAALVRDHKKGDALAPVTVVVPTNGVGVSARRWLATGAGIAGLTIVTSYRLAELLGAPALAGAGRRPMSTPVLAAAVRRVLHDDAGHFMAVARHPSTTEALVRVHAELSHCPAPALDVLAEQGARPHDVVRIHRAIRALLTDWYDERDLLTSAGAAVAAGTSVVDDLGSVVLFLPQDLPLAACELFQTLAARTSVTVLAGFTGADDADADVRRTLDRLGLHAVPREPVPGPRPRIVSVSDSDEEARTVVDEIITAARSGVPLERMAILYPSELPHAQILRDHLDAAGITWNGRDVTALKDRMAGRWVLDLLELVGRRSSRTAVMHLFASALVRIDGRHVPLTAWERASRDAGVVAGREHWDGRLSSHAATLRSQADAEEVGNEPRDWLADRLRRLANEAETLRVHVLRLVDDVAGLAALGAWPELAAATRGLVDTYLGNERERTRWPDVEREAAQKVDLALDRLAALGDLEPTTNLELFHHTLELELDTDLGRRGRAGVGVLVGPYSHALGTDLELVVLLGLAEGVAPTRPSEDPLLLDHERAPVADVLHLRAERVGVQHRHFRAALAAATTTPILVFPRGDLRRSIERAPSRWLLDQVEAHDGTRDLTRAVHEEVGSFAGRVRTLGFPATEQLHHLHTLGLGVRSHEHAPPATTAWQRGHELVLARRSDEFTRFDGNLTHVDGALVGRFRDARMMSPTRLENYAKCPHGHLVRYVLGVEPVEDPEDILEISPLDRGTLVHTTLERWLAGELADGIPAPTTPWSAEALARLLAIGEEECDTAEARGVTGHPVLWARDRIRILHDLRRFATEDDRRRAREKTSPVQPELAFGFDDDGVAIPFSDGTSVRFRGSIDRVDRDESGALHVHDLKTGSTWSFEGLSAEAPDKAGTLLQLPIYALAARTAVGEPDTKVHAGYWCISTRGKFKWFGYEVTEAILDRLHDVVETLVTSFEAGLFPQHPQEPGFRVFNSCWYCDPDEIGTNDIHRRWLHIRTEPELHDLVALIEPEAVEVES